MKVVRTTQPNGVVRIDPQNPLTRGLVFACVGGMPVDLVTGATPDTNSSTVEVTKYGRMQVTSTANPMVIPRTHRARPKRTTEFTMWVYGQNQSSVSWPRMAQIRDNDNTSLVFLEQDAGVSYWGFRGPSGNAFLELNGPSPSGGAATGIGVPYTYGFSLKENYFVRSFFNGKLHYSDASGSGMSLYDDATLTTNVTWANGTGTFGNYLTAIWDRTLDAGEFASMHANPWQLFEPEPYNRKKVFLPPRVTTTTKRWHKVPEVRRTAPTTVPMFTEEFDSPYPMALLPAVTGLQNPYGRGAWYFTQQNASGPSFSDRFVEGGFRLYSDAAGNNDDRIRAPYAIPTASSGAVTEGKFTTIIRFKSLSSPQNNYQPLQWQGNTSHYVRIEPTSIVAGYDAGNGFMRKGTINGPGIDDQWHTVVISTCRPYVEPSVAVDGMAASSFDGDVMHVGAGSPPTLIEPEIAGYEFANYYHFNGLIALAVWLPGVYIPQKRAAEVSLNPWQIFRFDKMTLLDAQTLYPTLSLAELINIAASQATPRVQVTVP